MSDPTAPDANQSDPTAPVGDPSGSAPAYGSSFGVTPPANIEPSGAGQSWVPQKADPAPQAQGASSPGQPIPQVPTNPYRGPVAPQSGAPGTPGGSDGSGGTGGSGGSDFQVKGWHIGAVLGVIFIPLVAWIALSMNGDDEPDPISRPSTTPTFTVSRPTLSTASISRRTTTYSPTTRTRTTTPPKTSMNPPATAKVSDIPVTPVPKQGTVIRFEAYAEKGTKIEVSFSSATAARLEYPAQEGPMAFEIPIGPNLDDKEYYSFRVRSDYSSAGTRPDVVCRVLVDGVVIVTEQGQGYATCYISPRYDAQRK